MTHFFIHNSFHSGDVILTRAVIQAVRISFPGAKITLECAEVSTYLWQDLDLPITLYQSQEYKGTEPTPNCPDTAIFVNMWFGVFDDILKLYGMTYQNNVHTFNRQMYQHGLNHQYLLPIPIHTPTIAFFGRTEPEIAVRANSILVENGEVFSNQSYFYLNEHLKQIASDFPQLNFYCSAPPKSPAANLVDCSGMNLKELSQIGDKSIGLLMKGSAINAACQTEINRYKPRCIVGWDLAEKLWDNLENPVVYAKNYAEVQQWLTKIVADITFSTAAVKNANLVATKASIFPTESVSKDRDNLLDKILIISHTKTNCGVHEYGFNIAKTLKNSTKYSFVYAECSSAEELLYRVNQVKPSAIIYNYHPTTLSWVNKSILQSINGSHIGIIHEVTQRLADVSNNSIFQYHIGPDPTLQLKNPIVFKTGRIIAPYTNNHKLPEIPTIGSFGFGLEGKGFEKLIATVQQEYDEALIRLHIPFATFGDADGSKAVAIAQRCQQSIFKPGIKLSLSHDFLSQEQLLDFLAQNTLNAFFYDRLENRGISSTIDHALAVKRPIAITKSNMFRHIVSAKPSICIEDSSLKQIVDNGIAPLVPFYNEWSEANFILDYERILAQVLEKPQKSHSQRYLDVGIPNVTSFNRILDDAARSQYAPRINQLFALVPEMMARKIPEANIQQAFILDTVDKFASQLVKPKILCVGSHEDSAAAALKQVGYQLEEIDPAINCDLNTYFHKPSTIKGSYDIIFSTSVIEHVQNDELFLMQIAELLAPGGSAVLTCDYNDQYKPGDRIPGVDFRLYTQKDFKQRLLPLLKNCVFPDVPQWDCPKPDFIYEGCRYTFATFVFQKNKL
ncbi:MULTISPECIES: methyltransferase domain-containing protein [unclassified Microcoleus]|uniref:methyltransferase domain-containing protein n=1 Tax=unclassified Microcoleus TaxID=2642155 RepID=UPI002FD18F56